MSAQETLLKTFESVCEDKHWHWIEQVTKVLEGVTQEEAEWHANDHTQSILEIVNHMAYWIDFTTRSLKGESLDELKPIPEDGSAPTDMPSSWEEAYAHLKKMEGGLCTYLSGSSYGDLTRHMDGWERTAAELINGLTTHQSYHIGQIYIIRKLWLMKS
jgi:uncharacterized damage-inducible protein DinB